jgi:hypothetical protein
MAVPKGRQRTPQQDKPINETTYPVREASDRPARNRKRGVKPGWKNIANLILNITVWIVTIPVQALNFLTQPPGSSILLGSAVVYFVALSAEGYWQTTGANLPSFVFKPFIEDGASLANIWVALRDLNFWIAGMLSLIIQSVQGTIIRDVNITVARMEAEELSKHREVNVPDNAIEIAHHKADVYRFAGMKAIRRRAIVILLTYAVDICAGYSNFPLFGSNGFGQMAVNLVWITLSVLGAELSMAWFMDAIDQGRKLMKAQAKVEVV